MKGYQYLQNDFFELCQTRRLRNATMLLLIYLRGLYHYFGEPVFYWRDSETLKHLGFMKPTLRNAREKLQKAGVIEFKTSIGRGKATEYKILDTVLAPSREKGIGMRKKGLKLYPFSKDVSYIKRGQNYTPKSYIDSKPLEYDNSKYKEEIKKHMSRFWAEQEAL